MKHDPDSAIFEHEPEPAMRRADAAIAAARAHASDHEVLDLLGGAAAMVQRAYERQLSLRGRARPASGVFPVAKSTEVAEHSAREAADRAERRSRRSP